MCVCAHTVYVCLCGYVTLSSVWLCVRDLSDTHPLYERHITLQLTLLDGDGPFNYSTLMQSAVNTLNQAAKEEAAYPSSLPLSPSLSFARTLYLSLFPLSLSLSLSLLSLSSALYLFVCICLLIFSLIYFLVSPPSLPLSESTLCRHSPVS